MCAMRTHFQGLYGHLQVIDRAGRRGEMQDIVQFARYVDKLGDIVVVVLEVFLLKQVFDVVEAAGEQVVHADDLVAFGEKAVAEVRADETGGAGDEDSFFCHDAVCGLLKKAGAKIGDLMEPESPGRLICKGGCKFCTFIVKSVKTFKLSEK